MKPRDSLPFSKIFVLYGRGVQSGGNLAAIQLVDKIRSLGGNAFLLPSPGTENWSPVEQYQGFDAPEAAFEDAPGNLLIISEYSFKLGASNKNAQLAVWWLSADKSVPFKVISAFRSRNLREIGKVYRSRILNGDLWAFLRILFRRRPWRTIHFAQSNYAKTRIQRAFGIRARLLGDYLHPKPATETPPNHDDTCKRIVTYNAKKGGCPKILRLAPRFPDWNWVPIEGVTPDEAIALLQSSCCFIDLGTLPGRDRLPREARVAGVPIAIAKRGSGASMKDFPLAEQFRVNLESDWAQQVTDFLDGLCHNREQYLRMQEPLLESIYADERVFGEQVESYFISGSEK